MNTIRRAFAVLLVSTALFGIAYPLTVTAIARLLFPTRAAGSPLAHDGVVVGSEWIAQSFTQPQWFWPRPSATSPPWNAASSSGSNLGPRNPALLEQALARTGRLELRTPAPVDLVTASGSGLDPHVTPAGALAQVERVARARGIDASKLAALVVEHIEPRTFGWLGEPRVNVLKLNLALESMQ